MSIVQETPDRHNWLTRLIDLIDLYDRSRRRFRESMLGSYLIDLRRARKLRKSR